MQETAEYRVLIVGCGRLGSRHLQAVASLPQVRQIEVVDPRPESLALGQERLEEITDRNPSISIRWLSSLEEATKGGDLCVVATQADVRCQLVHRLATDFGHSSFLLEKVVSESIRDYENLVDFSQSKGLSMWVNCKARAHPSHKRVKARLDSNEPVILNVVGGNHGLATNGVHAAALFSFYDGGDRIESAGSRVDQILHPSKRGNGRFDLSGTLHGYTPKGSEFTLSYASNHTGPAHYTVIAPRYRAVIDDMTKWFCESTCEDGWTWRQVPFEANLLVSNMTRIFAADILGSGRCELPTLEECYPAHRFVLSELLPHFNKLSGTRGDRCPVT